MFWVHLVSGSVWHPGPPRLQGLRAWSGLQWVPEPRWPPATWGYGPCPRSLDRGRGAVPQSPFRAGQGRRDRPVWQGRRPRASEGSPGGAAPSPTRDERCWPWLTAGGSRGLGCTSSDRHAPPLALGVVGRAGPVSSNWHSCADLKALAEAWSWPKPCPAARWGCPARPACESMGGVRRPAAAGSRRGSRVM